MWFMSKLELSRPSGNFPKVTKSDTVDIPGGPTRGLLVGTAGTATVIDATGATRTDVPLQAGYNPLRVKRIKTGGTADDIWALL